MGKYEVDELPELDRDESTESLTDELTVLRAKLGISKDNISNIAGTSRQAYSAIEIKKERCRGILFYP